MTERHAHPHPPADRGAPRAYASAPTLSLLRLSATQRLAGVGVVLVLLWAAILAVVG